MALSALHRALLGGYADVYAWLRTSPVDEFKELWKIVHRQHPGAEKIELFPILQNRFGPHPGTAECGGMPRGRARCRNGIMGYGIVRLNIKLPTEQDGFEKSFVVGIRLNENASLQKVARISFQLKEHGGHFASLLPMKVTTHYKEVDYEEELAENVPAGFFTG